MARVAVIVINSVSRDARVLKGADSLQQAGHEVTIFGIKDAENTLDREPRESGVVIRRVGWRAAAYRRVALTFVAVAVAAVVVAMPAGLVWGDSLLVAGWNAIAGAVTAAWSLVVSGQVGSVLGIIAAILLAVWSLGRARRYLQMARRYAALENPDELVANATSLRRWLKTWVAVHYKLNNWRRALAHAVVELNPDVVHCHDILALPLGARIKARVDCKLVYDAHEIYEDVAQGTPERGAVYRGIQRRHAKDVDLFVTINDSILAFYQEHYPALPDGIVVKNATLPAPPFDYDGRLHDIAELPRQQRIVLYQGGFAAMRGLQQLVASAAFLPPDWTLVMMGWGKLEQELRTIASRIDDKAMPPVPATALPTDTDGLPPRPGTALDTQSPDAGGRPERSLPAVCFVPPVPQAELPFWTAGATVGVIPYERVGLNHWFCTPNKLWEYPNAGVPALVSPFPELRQVVCEYGTGWLLPEPLTPEALAGAIRGLTDEQLTAARAACRAFIEVDNWHVYEQRLCRGYERLLG